MTRTKTRRAGVPQDPTQDYVAAAETVWHEMRNAALEQAVPAELKGQAGWIVTGASPRDIVRALWPRLVRSDEKAARRLMSSVRNQLIKSGNAFCLDQERKHTRSQWWVADEWTRIQRRARARNATKSPVVDPPRPPAEDQISLASSLASAREELRVGLLTYADRVVHLVDKTVALANETRELREENERLRERLDAISHVIGEP